MKKTAISIGIALVVIGGVYFISQNTHHSKHSGHASHAEVKNDRAFLEMMIPHHEEAVVSAEAVIARGETPEVKELARSIIDSQSAEIQTMKQWYTEWFDDEYEDTHHYTPMMPDLTTLKGKELDRAFVSGMIGHHDGAIQMAASIKEKTERPEMKTFAEAIITTQSKEVVDMQVWLGTLLQK